MLIQFSNENMDVPISEGILKECLQILDDRYITPIFLFIIYSIWGQPIWISLIYSLQYGYINIVHLRSHRVSQHTISDNLNFPIYYNGTSKNWLQGCNVRCEQGALCYNWGVEIYQWKWKRGIFFNVVSNIQLKCIQFVLFMQNLFNTDLYICTTVTMTPPKLIMKH